MDDSGATKERVISVPLLGENSYQLLSLGDKNVQQIVMTATRSGAVTSITYCFPEQPAPTNAPPTVGPAPKPTPVSPTAPSGGEPTPVSPTAPSGGEPTAPSGGEPTPVSPTQAPPTKASPTAAPEPTPAPGTKCGAEYDAFVR